MSANAILVFDIGSCYTRAGVAGDETPNVEMATLAALPDVFGSKAANLTNATRFVRRGMIRNFAQYEAFVSYIIKNSLSLNAANCSLFFAENPYSPPDQREFLLHHAFEDLRTRSMFMINSSLLTLYSLGRTTGVVADIGDQSGTIVAIKEGLTWSKGMNRSALCGELLTLEALRLLNKDSEAYFDLTFAEQVKAMEMKHILMDRAINNVGSAEELKLPDGSVVKIEAEPFKLLDVIFKNNDLQFNNTETSITALQNQMRSILLNYPTPTRNTLNQNIVISGGLGKSASVMQQLKREIHDIFPASMNFKVSSASADQSAAWKGGSILCSLSSFNNMWVSASEYEEHGPSVIHRKLF